MSAVEKTKPIRVSYSILSAWANGNIDDAVRPFIQVETFTNEFMARGKRWHRRWELETKRTGCAPRVFDPDGTKLVNPTTEEKRAVWLLPWLQLSGVVDLSEYPPELNGAMKIRDYKASMKTATAWANSDQAPVYGLLRPEAKLLEFDVFNPYLKDDDPEKVTIAFVHLSKKTMQYAAEWVITQASGLHDFLTTNGYDKNLMREEGKF